jgi:hypothetical protein
MLTIRWFGAIAGSSAIALSLFNLEFHPDLPLGQRATAQETAQATAQLVSQAIAQAPTTPDATPRSRVRRIRFAPGSYGSTLEDAVLLGTRDIYLVGASKGQTMSITLTSLENNAVFDLQGPAVAIGQRRLRVQSSTTLTQVLPISGDYYVIVGSTRGNATYRLSVTIR